MKVKNWQKVIKIGGPKSFLDPCLTILMNTQYLEKPINIINGWFYSVSTIDALSVSNFNKGSTVYSKDCISMAVSILKLRIEELYLSPSPPRHLSGNKTGAGRLLPSRLLTQLL